MSDPLAVCFGCAGLSLHTEERAFFQEINPLGFILFERNVDTPDQVRTLIDDLRCCVDHDDVPILIDQEGGDVQRLRPPHWRDTPSPAKLSELYDIDMEKGLKAAWLNARLIADDLYNLGIDVNCLPVLDLPTPNSHPFLHSRAAGHSVENCINIGQADIEGLLAGGVLPVIKHMPGHGRAIVDSHKSIPEVNASLNDLEMLDFAPFKALADCPWGMTAHVIYSKIDQEFPATQSSKVIREIIRGTIGFDGFLVSDDIGMDALNGPMGKRAETSLNAGCDAILHCSGDMAEMLDVTKHLNKINDDATRRLEESFNAKCLPTFLDRKKAEAELNQLLKSVRESS